jgi:hypothetical protein
MIGITDEAVLLQQAAVCVRGDGQMLFIHVVFAISEACLAEGATICTEMEAS